MLEVRDEDEGEGEGDGGDGGGGCGEVVAESFLGYDRCMFCTSS